MRKLAFVAFFSVICAGCGSSTDDTGTTDQDSSVETGEGVDSGARDSGTIDSAKDSSSDAPRDSSSDTAATDSTSDTAVTDSAGDDTSTTDTAPIDVGGDTDFPCGPTSSCKAGQICIEDNVMGGACLTCDSSTTCPSGMHCPAGGGCCVRDPTFRCADKPTACATGVTCLGDCGKALCPSGIGIGGCGCEGPSSDGTITCNVCAP